jgi:hypothetical protein
MVSASTRRLDGGGLCGGDILMMFDGWSEKFWWGRKKATPGHWPVSCIVGMMVARRRISLIRRSGPISHLSSTSWAERSTLACCTCTVRRAILFSGVLLLGSFSEVAGFFGGSLWKSLSASTPFIATLVWDLRLSSLRGLLSLIGCPLSFMILAEHHSVLAKV